MNHDLTIVITCFDQEETIVPAIESVLAQAAQHAVAEVLVVDDGSTDASVHRLVPLLQREPLVRLIRQQNSGAGAARNRGVAEATTTFVAFLDGDDTWLPNKLEIQSAAFDSERRVALYYSDFRVVDANGEPLRVVRARPLQHEEDALATLFVEGASIIPSTAVVRTDAFLAAGGFDEDLATNEDPDLWLRLAAEHPIEHIPGVVVQKRELPGSLGSDVALAAATQHEITDRCCERWPRLRQCASTRRARIEVRLGLALLEAGQRWAALTHLGRSLRYRCANPRAFVYLAVALAPGRPASNLQRLKHRLRSHTRLA